MRLKNFGCGAIRAITRTGSVASKDKVNTKTQDDVAIEKMIEEGNLIVGAPEDFPRFAATTNIVFLCLTQNPDTIEIVNEEYIRALSVGAIIVNVSRGGIVNYDDVVKCLDDGQLGGFGADVFKHEPFPHSPNPTYDDHGIEEVDPLWLKYRAFLEHEKWSPRHM